MDKEKLISVVEQTNRGERTYDLASRLLEDRIIFLSGEVDTDLANYVIAQLIYLEAKDPNKEVFLYINSPGGSISDGMAIFDTMNYIQCDVNTIAMGLAASMGAFLLAAGTKGKRYALPNSEIMIHQPLGGAQGQASDIMIAAQHIAKTKQKMNKYLAEMTGQDISVIERDTDRDNFMTSEEALEYGIIDRIFYPRKA
jgi:Protease subunit of ATP-dependent Clp proteases